MAVLTINQYIDTIDSFVNNVENSRNSYYLFFGKVNSWVNADGAPDDTAVPTAAPSIFSYEQSIYKDLVFGKLITPNDITYMIPRYDWESGTVYSSYSQTDEALYDKQFYVMNNSNEVYKCIDNNNGAESTVKPSLNITSGVFSTSDGYVWKYMYTLDSDDNVKFTSTYYIPVSPNSSVIDNAVPGSIDFIKVSNTGNNYQAWHTGYLQNFQSNYIIQIANTASPITGRYVNSAIYLKSGFGSGQIRNIINYNGPNRLVTVPEPFETSVVLNLTNFDGTEAGFNTGLLVTQRIDTLSYLYQKGFFNIGETIIQSDTVATGKIISANVTQLKTVKSSTSDFVANLPFYNTVQSAVLKTGRVDIKTNVVRSGVVINPGSGYNANSIATITINPDEIAGVGAGAVANAQSNSTGRISAINIANSGSGYVLDPVIAINPPAPIYFNSNSSVNSVSNFISLGSNSSLFANDDTVKYLVASGNTALAGLASGNYYFVVSANSSGFKISTSGGGTPISLTKGLTESGHSFTGETATANVSILTYVITANSTTPPSFVSEFAVGDYLRVGVDTTKNIRRVLAVNSSVITVNYPLATNATSNSIYSVPYAAMPTSAAYTLANGIISNTNLTSVTLTYSNSSINSLLFTIGERVDMVGENDVKQTANGIISFCNTSTIILSAVIGTFETGPNNFIRGVSSLQKAHIDTQISFPNITLESPEGRFISGQRISVKTLPELVEVANADLIASYRIPNELTEYIISPAVTITGDGEGALAYSVVNSTFGSANDVTSVVVLNPGNNYTYANISITSNNIFGYGALAEPVISPLSGHGYNPYKELGARYAGISMTIDTGENEGYKFPVFGSYRKVGIIENPLFEDVSVHIENYTRIDLTYENIDGPGFEVGEYCVQSNSSAAGIIEFANSTFLHLKNTVGNFVEDIGADDIIGLSTGTTANVIVANVANFIASDVEIVSEITSNAYGHVIEANNTVLKLTDVSGRFDINDVVYDAAINAYADVTAIYTVNNTIESSSSFGRKFSQVARLTLTSNTGSYVVGERVTQDIVQASGYVFNTDQDIDIVYENIDEGGSFNIGNEITDETTGATGLVTYANTTYLRVTAKNGSFVAGHTILNNVDIAATITNVYPVLILNDVKGNRFQQGTYIIVGDQSGAVGRNQVASTIIYPELVRDSGSIVYFENIAPITKSSTSKEKINLIIKF